MISKFFQIVMPQQFVEVIELKYFEIEFDQLFTEEILDSQ
jgi:hypothetical protein